MPIEIKEVSNINELKKFIRFQNHLYRTNANYVPTFEFDELNTLLKTKNPAFDFCESKYWLAYKDGKLAGRIAGIISHAFIKKWGKKYARFGWVDFIDDYQVAEALFKTLENWAKENGLEAIHGPLGFTDLDKEGLMIEGFNELGSIATIYNHAYYPEYFERFGLAKDVDWVQYEIDVPQVIPERIADFAKVIEKKYQLRPLKVKNSKQLLPYAVKMFNLLNITYEKLYGVVPLNDKQIKAYTDQYFGFIRHEFVAFVLDANDDVAAFAITIPSLSKAVQKSKGKLFPFGFYHILKALKKNDTLDLFLIGINPIYHGKGVNAIIFNELCNACIHSGITKAIAFPQLEDNKKVNALWKYFTGRQHIRRRCYVKTI